MTLAPPRPSKHIPPPSPSPTLTTPHLQEAHHHSPERLKARDGPQDAQRPQRPQRPHPARVAADGQDGDVAERDHREVKHVPGLAHVVAEASECDDAHGGLKGVEEVHGQL